MAILATVWGEPLQYSFTLGIYITGMKITAGHRPKSDRRARSAVHFSLDWLLWPDKSCACVLYSFNYHHVLKTQLQVRLASCHSYSVLMDGSADKGRVENELFVILFGKRDDTQQQISTCARYFCVLEPTKADADGLIECLSRALV